MQAVDLTPRSYCPGCMSRFNADGVCGNAGCHWHEVDQMESYDHLPRHFVLMDRYYIGRVLGQGGFGVTYMARDLKLDDLVAVKEFLPREQCSRLSDRVTVGSHGGDKAESFQAGIDGFLNEARALNKLAGHPNILSVKDFNKANGTAYLVMEYLSGRTLKQYLQSQGGRIPSAVAVDIMLHVMAGLRKVHANGLLHRDVSPDNIMITDQGPVKLLDFGSARYAVGEQSKSLSIILKAGYSPEEQYRTRGKQGPWTDVYAVAATLYRCITGHVPPPSLDRLSEAEDELVRPSKLAPGLDPALEAVILKGLAVRASERYQTIDEFQEALLAAQKAAEPIKQPDGPQVGPVPVSATPLPVTPLAIPLVETPKPNSNPLVGRPVAQRVMALAALLAAVACAVEWLQGWNDFGYGRGASNLARCFGYMQPRLIGGAIFFLCCSLVHAGVARRAAIRWSAWLFAITEIAALTRAVVANAHLSGYSMEMLVGAFLIDAATILFLVPTLLGIRSRKLDRVFAVLSMALLIALLVIAIDYVRGESWIYAWPTAIFGPVREYLFFYDALAYATSLSFLLGSTILFLALSLRFALPDETTP